MKCGNKKIECPYIIKFILRKSGKWALMEAIDHCGDCVADESEGSKLEVVPIYSLEQESRLVISKLDSKEAPSISEIASIINDSGIYRGQPTRRRFYQLKKSIISIISEDSAEEIIVANPKRSRK